MTAARVGTLAAALLAVAACYTSPPAANDPAAVDPHGIRGRLVMENGRRAAVELLMIDDTMYVVATAGQIAIARHSDVRSAEFERLGALTFRARSVPSPRVVQAARVWARFPYGIPANAMAAMLASAHQDAPIDLAMPASATP